MIILVICSIFFYHLPRIILKVEDCSGNSFFFLLVILHQYEFCYLDINSSHINVFLQLYSVDSP